ncbi:unnamed protein product [Didymodactylos carnosus]|uniref:DUF4460 domain-containing protein n=1 Tax=Didymodactylos carnosus TaxID=1234261 RepID=A0A815IRU1_9BILA|nr:unnamed protein product [Didymodactylos carnosus]CAF1369254.1 unnamed protein product [Didymodactylos carnosus]CAF3578641.1 unnamed protein product [Didymodactylos carnosus]CAF4254024.1 unnamed protein product [Didymodactylos carnosus]
MIFRRCLATIKLIHLNRLYCFCYYYSTERPETISSALKRFYMKVHPDLFSQYPTEKDVNEKSLQIVSAYLSSLQRKEYVTPVTVTFYVKSGAVPNTLVNLLPYRVTLKSKDLITCVNSILYTFNLQTVDVPKETKEERRFNIIEIEKQYDFSKIPKISIKTWLITNVAAAREIAKRNKELLDSIKVSVNYIKQRFKLKALDYNDEWSLSHFNTCLRTLSLYTEKWNETLRMLEGKRLIFGTKTALLKDGSVELCGADPPVYWDTIIGSVLPHRDSYLEQIKIHENSICKYFTNIEIQHDPGSDFYDRATTYVGHLQAINRSLNMNLNHVAHTKYNWKNYYLFINPYSSEPSVTESGLFQINAYDDINDSLDFMVQHRSDANNAMTKYLDYVESEKQLLNKVMNEYQLDVIRTNKRMKKEYIIECCQRLLNERNYLGVLLSHCRLKIDTNYNIQQDGTICIPWNWETQHD